jgi:2-succinyl-5-enolpyruvyl-6-hydroxy-3-cyclohexene-1-carboxylate synthase
MQVPNRTYLLPVLLADELARAGVRHACVSPGSRSAPLALALAGRPEIRLWSHVDERSGAFFALGLAKASHAPVALVCTSGTAAANFLPAVVEAWHARVPLVVLTADRPPELHDCGAGQTIDQLRLFGTHVRWFADTGTLEPTPDGLRRARTLACRAVAAAAGPPAGPVHLNVPLREPLAPEPVPGDLPADLDARAGEAGPGREDAPWTRVHAADEAPAAEAVAATVEVLARAERPLVVAGPLDDPDPRLAGGLAELAGALGAPVIAEAASNLRRAPLLPLLADAHDALARDRRFVAAHAPDVVLRLGAPPTSKALASWLATLDGVPQVLLDATGGWPDPGAVATHLVRGRPGGTLAALGRALPPRRRDPAWAAGWRAAGVAARAALAAAAGDEPQPFEAHAVAALARALPAGALLYAGNSMAIRALDAFWPADAPPVRVLANRGANGIDGFVSSVLGAAAGGGAGGCPVVGLCGDLSFYHDLNGLLAVSRHGVRATLVVLDNDGGGIFDFLPIAAFRERYEELFATPHGLDFRPAVEMYGAGFERVTAAAGLAPALARALGAPRTTVVDFVFGRGASVAAHGRAWARAQAAVERA